MQEPEVVELPDQKAVDELAGKVKGLHHIGWMSGGMVAFCGYHSSESAGRIPPGTWNNNTYCPECRNLYARYLAGGPKP